MSTHAEISGHEDWTKHAPPGGITLGGKYFEGGTFIPNEDMERATPAEKEELKRAEDLVAKYGPDKAKKLLVKFQAEKKLAAQASKEKEQGQEVIYVVDDGKILGGSYGAFIIRNNPLPQLELLPKETNLLNAIGVKRMDVIISGEVISIYANNEGKWPSATSIAELQQSGAVKISKIPLQQWDVLNNLSPEIQKIFNPATVESLRLSTSKQTPKIKMVDVEELRSSSLEMQEFGNVGTHVEFKNIPEDEIWISDRVNTSEIPFFELNGRVQLETGSIAKALKAEKEARREKDPEGVSVKVKKYKTIKDGDDLLTVWLVDGERVRNTLQTSFMEGMNDQAEDYMPKGEIWLEQNLTDKEKEHVLLHELTERRLMKYDKLPYHKAHKIAAQVEFEDRRAIRFANRHEYSLNAFAHKLYEVCDVPIVPAKYIEEEHICRLSLLPGSNLDFNNPLQLGRAIDIGGVLDKVIGNKHSLTNIIIVAGVPFRNLNNCELDSETTEVDPYLDILPDKDKQTQVNDLLTKIRPLLDSLLEEVDFPKEHRQEFKDKILDRLNNLVAGNPTI